MKSIKLYSFTLPIALFPLMDFSFGQIPKYFKGLEFRAFIAELLAQLVTGVVDAGVVALFQGLLG